MSEYKELYIIRDAYANNVRRWATSERFKKTQFAADAMRLLEDYQNMRNQLLKMDEIIHNLIKRGEGKDPR